jgi:V/A-type H+-transporting ATPase subunit C
LLELLLEPNNPIFWIFIAIIILVSIMIVWWPFNIYVKFSYINARLEALGNPFLNDKELNRMIESKNIIEFRDTLNNIKDYNITGDNSEEIQKSLDINYIKNLEQLKKESSKYIENFIDIFYEKIDLEFLKKLIKSKMRNENIEKFTLDDINIEKIKKLSKEIIEIDNEKINDVLMKYNYDVDIKYIQLSNELDYILLDNKFDRYLIKKLKDIKIPKKCSPGKLDFVNFMTDIENIKNILRAKNQGYDEKICYSLYLGDGKEISDWKYKELSQCDDVNQIIISLEGTSYYPKLKDSIEIYNQNNSTQIFEHALDEHYLKILKEISIQNYVHIGPILRFLISKKYEIMNLKIISKGIDEGINSNIIKNLLIRENN